MTDESYRPNKAEPTAPLNVDDSDLNATERGSQAAGDSVQPPNTTEPSSGLRVRIVNGVRVVRVSNVGPITMHSIGSSEGLETLSEPNDSTTKDTKD